MNYLVPFLAIALFACTTQPTDLESNETATTQTEEQVPSKSEAAKAWLIAAIEDHFKEDFPKMETISTKQYQNYWKDQLEVEYGDLSMEEFTAKWGSTYDLDRAEIGTGFLIDAQDYTTIVVTSCELMKSARGDQFNFQVKLNDKGFNAEYKREITVVPSGDSFLIDDVKNWK